MTPPDFSMILPEQRKVLEFLADLPGAEELLLGGGTPLAWHLRHRRSWDLDFVAPSSRSVARVGDHLEEAARSVLPFFEPLGASPLRREFVLETDAGRVRVEIAVDADHRGELDPGPAVADLGIRMRGFRDLAASKTAALAARREPRDYFDFFHLARTMGAVSAGRLARKKYVRFSLAALGRALADAAAIVPTPESALVEPVSAMPDWSEVLSTLESAAAEILRSIRKED